MEPEKQWIEELTGDSEKPFDIEELVHRYENRYTSEELPEEDRLSETDVYFKIIKDIDFQVMIYRNIIEQLKSGNSASDIRERFENLQLVPPGTLPNPDGSRLLDFALSRLEKLRDGLFRFIKARGKQIINAVSLELGLTVGLGLSLGMTPSLSITAEGSADVKVN